VVLTAYAQRQNQLGPIDRGLVVVELDKGPVRSGHGNGVVRQPFEHCDVVVGDQENFVTLADLVESVNDKGYKVIGDPGKGLVQDQEQTGPVRGSLVKELKQQQFALSATQTSCTGRCACAGKFSSHNETLYVPVKFPAIVPPALMVDAVFSRS
jgi:hypothetical protein